MLDATSFDPCYRHPKRMTGVRCQRCSRPICPRCMVAADVGFHCRRCIYGWAAPLHELGARLGGGPRWVRRWRGRASLALIIAVIVLYFFRR